VDPGKVLNISDQVDGIVYTIPDKTNVVVFANKYNLNLQDLMTLNYVQKSTVTYRPTINKSGKPSVKTPNKSSAIAYLTDATDTPDIGSTIISKWTYTKKISNGFYA
jgi:hypothetical protein